MGSSNRIPPTQLRSNIQSITVHRTALQESINRMKKIQEDLLLRQRDIMITIVAITSVSIAAEYVGVPYTNEITRIVGSVASLIALYYTYQILQISNEISNKEITLLERFQ